MQGLCRCVYILNGFRVCAYIYADARMRVCKRVYLTPTHAYCCDLCLRLVRLMFAFGYAVGACICLNTITHLAIERTVTPPSLIPRAHGVNHFERDHTGTHIVRLPQQSKHSLLLLITVAALSQEIIFRNHLFSSFYEPFFRTNRTSVKFFSVFVTE